MSKQSKSSDIIETRVIEEAYYVLKNRASIPETARQFSVSVSTVRSDLTVGLLALDVDIYNAVQAILRDRHCMR